MTKTRPIFLVSLPRSGSTLLQRILAAHPMIATASEPWIMLPLLYSIRTKGIAAEYDHASAALAVQEFSEAELGRGIDDFESALARLAGDLYDTAAEGKAFFLDKTPRYHLIVRDLLKLFPDSPMILLWRNPLSIAASMIETFGQGKWILDVYAVDLFEGLERLTDVVAANSDRFIPVNYERLVSEPVLVTRRLLSELGVEYPDGLIDRFAAVSLTGTMGNPTGTKTVALVESARIESWRDTFRNPVRKAWAMRYIRWIGPERLALMGYDFAELEASVNSLSISGRHVMSDLSRIGYGPISRLAARELLRRPGGNGIFLRNSWR